MPHREPNNWPADSVAVEACRDFDGKVTQGAVVWVVLPSNHPDSPGKVVGEVAKIDDEHFDVYAFHDDQRKYHISSFTSVDYAIASIQFLRGRLTKKSTKEIKCPYCGEAVFTVKDDRHSYAYGKSRIRVVDQTNTVVLTDSTRSGSWSVVHGHMIHECKEES